MAGIIKEIWRREIIGSLYKDNDFLKFCVDASEYVKDGTIVHIPQAGIPSGVQVDRTVLPATISERVDTEVAYTLKEFTSDPKLVRNIDTIQLSYNKIQSVIAEDMANLKEKVADWMLRLWTPAAAGNILRTTGADVAAAAPSATGTRKGLAPADFLEAMLRFDEKDVPKAGRKAIVPARMMAPILQNLDLWKRDVGGELSIKDGVIQRLYGFDILVRSTVNVFDNAATPVAKNPGVAGAATDNLASLFWHPTCVEGAVGNVEAFYDMDKPEYFGSLFSFLVMAGGRPRRGDGKGVLSVVEAAGA